MDNAAELSTTATANSFAVNKSTTLNERAAGSRIYTGFANKPRGFTLIELLVVLVIISMFSGMIVLSIGDNFSRELRSEAERFQRLVVAASDEAIFTSSQLGVAIDKSRYSLVRFDPVSQSWLPLTGQAFRLHSLPESMKMSWSIEGFSRPGSDDAPQDINFGDGNSSGSDEDDDDNNSDRIGAYGLGDESDIDAENIAQKDLAHKKITPQILMLSSGEVTVFTVEFSAIEAVANNYVVSVISDGFSLPSIKSIQDDSND
ncbi:MAG: type II secretion system minor pseudopilin GspH [Pseudomonadales bacterium]